MNTYGALKATIADWLDREDMAARIPDFIRLAEEDIFDGLRCHDNEFVLTVDKVNYTLGDNAPIPTTDELISNLPSNYREMRLVTFDDRVLREISSQEMQAKPRSDPLPMFFSVWSNKITFSKALGAVADWEDTSVLTYHFYGTESLDAMPTYQVSQNPVENPPIERLPEDLAQGESNTTRMLQRHPQLYLHGALRHAELFLKNPQAAALHEVEFVRLKTRLERSATELTGSTVTVRNAYQEPMRSY